jgi:predicted Zn-dependent peptidase
MEHVRSVTLGIWVNAGARDETAALNGISHFLEHMHFKGTRTRTAVEIANAIDAVGGELNAFTSREGTTYYVKILDTRLDIGIDILSDILLHSTYPEAEIEKERDIIIDEIRMSEDTPDDYVHDLFNKTIWGDDGPGRSVLGSPETVGAIGRAELAAFVGERYRPHGIVISAAGRFDPDALASRLNACFGRMEAGPQPPARPPSSPFGNRFSLTRKDTAEAHICIGVEGIRADDPDRYALSVLNTIFGNGTSSRLFQEIRERRGLAYSVYSYLSAYCDTGLFGVYAGVDPRKAAEVSRLVLAEFARLPENMDSASVSLAKEQLKGNLILGLESTSSRMNQMARNEIYLGRHFTLEDILERIEAVTVDNVRLVAERLVRPDRLAMTVLGPVTDSDIAPEVMTFK